MGDALREHFSAHGPTPLYVVVGRGGPNLVRGMGNLVLDASVGRGMEPDEMEAGLSYRECSTAMELVARNGGLSGIAATGFDPDASAVALKAAYGYLSSALGKRIPG